MARVFISYRREDSRTVANIIYNRLLSDKKNTVFIDNKAIPGGFDFRSFIVKQIKKYDIMLSIIGNQWMTVKDDKGLPRISNAEDPLSMEVAAGLQNKKMLIIPILIDNTKMPDEDFLPENIKVFSFLNAVQFRSEEIDKSLENIVQEIERSMIVLKNDAEENRLPVSKDLSGYVKVLHLKDGNALMYALVNAMQANLLADKNIAAELDVMDLYKKTRKVDNLAKNEGSYFETAIFNAEFHGIKINKWTDKNKIKTPKPAVVKLRDYRTDILPDMIEHLDANRPLIIGVTVFEGMLAKSSTKKDGTWNIIPKPKSKIFGKHMVVVTKIDLKNDRIKFVNTWGKEWGDQGFGYFTTASFEYVLANKEIWAISARYE